MTMIAKKVLIIEDSQTQAQTLQKVLEVYGLRVLWAPGGRIGIQLAEQWIPDVVILDVKMPEMDGFEVCACLRDNPKTEHIPVVMMTRYNEPDTLKMGIYLGAVDFIPKDEFANMVLVKTLEQLRVLQDDQVYPSAATTPALAPGVDEAGSAAAGDEPV